jgi:hypothetical protein
MRLSDFEAMVRRLAAEVPADFYEGVAEVVVSPRALPHPTRAEVYTLGECIPLPAAGGPESDPVQSRVVLYHGSFAALARLQRGFDWREEAWETLTHELRHHLEWRARTDELEALDRAVEQNFARQEGDPFDPAFYLDGERPAEGVYRVEDDYFLDRVVRSLPPSVSFEWHGRAYTAAVPPDATLPCLLTVEGVAEPPPGDLIVALRRPPRLRDLFGTSPQPFAATVRAAG